MAPAPTRPRFGFIALFGVVTITGAVIFFVHHQQTQERKVNHAPRLRSVSRLLTGVRCALADDAPSRAA